MNENLDDVIREYIDFVNRQVGVYMDALAGFAGHRTRVERQVHRISRAIKAVMILSPERHLRISQLRIFCRMAVRGVLAFYNGQTQAEGYLR